MSKKFVTKLGPKTMDEIMEIDESMKKKYQDFLNNKIKIAEKTGFETLYNLIHER